jgi:hypothetical protein
MQRKSATEALKASILKLERRQSEEGVRLKAQFAITYESLKPINVLRKAIADVFNPPDIEENMVNTLSGLASGYLTNKLLVRSSSSPLLRLAASFIQYSLANLLAKNSDSVKIIGMKIIDQLIEKFRKK